MLHGCSLVAVSRGYSLVVVCGFPVAAPSLVVEHRLLGAGFASFRSQALEHGLSSCGARV